MQTRSWLKVSYVEAFGIEAFTRDLENTTLAESLGIEGANEGDLYAAMDCLYERQDVIEKRLAAKHLQEGGRVFYDLSSSYFEGQK